MSKSNNISKNGSSFDPSSTIIESSIEEPVSVYRFASITKSEIKTNCIIGDFARVTNSQLGKFVRIDRFNLLYHSTVESYSYTGPFDVIMHSRIGKFCSISWGVTIGPGEHDFHKISSHDFLYNDFYGIKPLGSPVPYNRFQKPCIIGSDVWIGANATILRGVTIGDGAVIGANSIVTKDIPPYAIAVGNPAKIIKYRFSEKTIERLLQARWWDLPIEKIKKKYKAFLNESVDEGIRDLMDGNI